MNKIYIVLIVVIFIISIAYNIYFKYKQKKLNAYVLKALLEKNYSKFDSVINTKVAKKYIPQFNLNFLKFNSYILRDDKNQADSIFDSSITKKMTNQQKLSFYSRAISYYIDINDKKRSKKCYDVILSIKGYDKEKLYLKMLYDVMVLNDISYQKEIEKKIDNDDDQEKAVDYHLLAHIYKVEKDDVQFQKYETASKELVQKINSK